MITTVAAFGNNYELARNGNMLWTLPDDYARFKAITLNHPVIMGRKSVGTMEDIIKDRTVFALSRNPDYKSPGVISVGSMEEALEKAKAVEENVFIIGGGQIYKMGMKYADKLEVTRVHADFLRANVFFPVFKEDKWELVKSENHDSDNRHLYSFTYETWTRKK